MQIRNLNTGYISSQYHCVFDDWFETVYSPADVDPEWEEMQLFQLQAELDPEDNPRLADEWLTVEEAEELRPQSTSEEVPGGQPQGKS
jgi:hypothetical protein